MADGSPLTKPRHYDCTLADVARLSEQENELKEKLDSLILNYFNQVSDLIYAGARTKKMDKEITLYRRGSDRGLHPHSKLWAAFSRLRAVLNGGDKTHEDLVFSINCKDFENIINWLCNIDSDILWCTNSNEIVRDFGEELKYLRKKYGYRAIKLARNPVITVKETPRKAKPKPSVIINQNTEAMEALGISREDSDKIQKLFYSKNAKKIREAISKILSFRNNENAPGLDAFIQETLRNLIKRPGLAKILRQVVRNYEEENGVCGILDATPA